MEQSKATASLGLLLLGLATLVTAQGSYLFIFFIQENIFCKVLWSLVGTLPAIGSILSANGLARLFYGQQIRINHLTISLFG